MKTESVSSRRDWPTFTNPPVVQSWIAVEFSPIQLGKPWAIDVTEEFLKEFLPEHSGIEYLQESSFQVWREPGKKVQLKKQIEDLGIRVFSTDRFRCWQATPDKLVFSLLAGGINYPGFETHLVEAIEFFEQYLRRFPAESIKEAVLFFDDVITLPSSDNGVYRLDHWLEVFKDIDDEPFGNSASIEQNCTFICPTDPGVMSLTIKAPYNIEQDKVFRIRMTWLKVCSNVDSLDFSIVSDRLRTSHRYLLDCFYASLAEKTVELFYK